MAELDRAAQICEHNEQALKKAGDFKRAEECRELAREYRDAISTLKGVR